MFPIAQRIRRVLAVFAAVAICTLATLVGGMTPAHAAASANLLMKATGSVYTADDEVYLGMTPTGGSKSWSLKIVNTGDNFQQFKVSIQGSPDSFSAVSLFDGSTSVPVPYYTKVIGPGGSAVLTLKIFVANGAPQNHYAAQVDIKDPETNTVVDTGFAVATATYQTGIKRNDLFLKTGSQPFVGGSINQIESSTAIKVGSTATFTLRIKNDGASPANAIGLKWVSGGCAPSYSVTVKQGTTDVSTAVKNGTYATGLLNPGAKVELKVQIKQLSAASCTSTYFHFTTSGPDGFITQRAHVLAAA
jgi:hypothetical protein